MTQKQAAIRAGYSARTARQQAVELLAADDIRHAIQAAELSTQQRNAITIDDLLSELEIAIQWQRMSLRPSKAQFSDAIYTRLYAIHVQIISDVRKYKHLLSDMFKTSVLNRSFSDMAAYNLGSTSLSAQHAKT
jgi:phage terminase small subunit